MPAAGFHAGTSVDRVRLRSALTATRFSLKKWLGIYKNWLKLIIAVKVKHPVNGRKLSYMKKYFSNINKILQ